MTKNEFIEFYDIFVKVVKQEVSGQYCMNACAELVDFCGGYSLVLRPDMLLWGAEVSMIHALCEKFCHTFEIDMQRGALKIW